MTFAPTCFGSRRNHQQGVVLCLAENTSGLSLLVGTDAVNVMAAYLPVVQACVPCSHTTEPNTMMYFNRLF